MIIPDVNLLLYAVISGFDQHDRSRDWWQDALNGPVRVGLAQPALFGFLRIATSSRILTSPLLVPTALAHIRDWLGQQNAELLVPGRDHLEIALGLLETAGTAGNLSTDAQLAAHALELDATLCSNDTDFGRFPDLRWLNPLA